MRLEKLNMEMKKTGSVNLCKETTSAEEGDKYLHLECRFYFETLANDLMREKQQLPTNSMRFYAVRV